MSRKPLNILLINCDWRNIFQNQFHELVEKLERDRLNPNFNHFFLFSWAHVSYEEKKNEFFRTVHRKTYWCRFKPVFEFMSRFVIPRRMNDEAKKGWKADIITCYDLGFLPTARKIQKQNGGKIVMCINNMPRLYSATRRFGQVKSLYSWFLEKKYKHIPDYYFTINQAMKQYLLDLGIPSEKIHLFAMNTIHRDAEHIASAKKGIIRAQYEIKPEEKILLCVARLEAEKGYPRLLDLFATLPKEHHLIILGQGSLLSQFQEQAKKLGIEKRVHFAGFVQRKDIWNYYKDTNVFVLLSKVEALGVVFWEAMHAGVPVVGSIAPGIVETVGHHDERGLIIQDDAGVADFQKAIAFSTTPSAELEKKKMLAKEFVLKEIQNTTTINDIV